MTARAALKGMIVNDTKTKLMCATVAKTFEARATLNGRNGEIISASDKIKTLGYWLPADCGQASNVKAMGSKMRAKTWALQSLKRCGFDHNDLITVYKSMMRPIVEYSSPAWGSMLTGEQGEALERHQTQALKHIFGPGLSAKKMRQMANIDTLGERRERAALKFARKAELNPRFKHWFTERDIPGRARRESASYRCYEEVRFRTDRHMNSPLNYLRRLLNKNGAQRNKK